MLFIAGVKQQDALPTFTNATAAMPNSTEIGRQAGFTRHFEGQIKDFHLSSGALYSANFTPPCPDRVREASTIGLWNFSETSGNTAADSSLNNYDAPIFGATRDTSTICRSVSVEEKPSITSSIRLFPNPVNDQFEINLLNASTQLSRIQLYSSTGQLVLEQSLSASKLI